MSDPKELTKRSRGRPKGSVKLDRPRQVINTKLLTELILVSAHQILGVEPTAPEIEEKLGLGRPSDATGRRSGTTWKNMRRGTAPLNDERLLQLARLAIRVEWLTKEQLDEVNYALANQAVDVKGPKVFEALAQRRRELSEYKLAKLQAYRALTKLATVIETLVQSEPFDGVYEEFDFATVEAGLDPQFLPFNLDEALHRLARLDLRFRNLDLAKPKLTRRGKPTQAREGQPGPRVVKVDEMFSKLLRPRK